MFPSKQLKLILAWYVIYQNQLMQNWALAKIGKPLNRIKKQVLGTKSPTPVFIYIISFTVIRIQLSEIRFPLVERLYSM